MINVVRRALASLIFLMVFSPALLASSADAEQNSAPIDVMGKVTNHDYFELAGTKIYLPRILYAGGEWFVYSNTYSALDSGEFVRGEEGGLIRADGQSISFDLSITSHLIYVWLSLIVTFIITYLAGRKYKQGIGRSTEPKGALLNIFEALFVFIRDQIAKEFIPANKYEKFVPYLYTIFLTITLMNLFGLLPWAAAATANLTVTATLAFITFLVTQLNGTKDHWQHVFVFPGVPKWALIILTPVEILGLFTKPFALAIRLFANMLSGKIMIVCILGLIFVFTELFGAAIGVTSGIFWVLLTVALYFLKALVALIQAYVFTLLSSVFIGMAVEEHHHDHEESSVANAKDVVIQNH